MHQNRRKRQTGIALEIVHEVAHAVAEGLPADATLARIFRRERGYGGRDRRQYAHAVFSFFRWRGWAEKIAPGNLRRQVALGVTMDPDAEDATRQLWREYADLSDATARHLASFQPEAMAASGLTLDDLMPAWLPEVMPDEASRAGFIQSCARRPPAWVAVPESHLERFGTFLRDQGIRFTLDQRLPGAVAIHDRFHLESLEKAWGQAIQVQDIASQAVVRVCDAQPGETWLDLCAGAGGKTLGLALAVGPGGHVRAIDRRETIIRNLVTRATAHGFANITTGIADAKQLSSQSAFNGVLVDAPCSGLGTWPRNPDARWRTSREEFEAAANTQAALLEQAAKLVKPGGKLIYSVCTLTEEEGPGLIRAVSAKAPRMPLIPFPCPLTGRANHGYVAISPDQGPGDGMFIAKFGIS